MSAYVVHTFRCVLFHNIEGLTPSSLLTPTLPFLRDAGLLKFANARLMANFK